MKRTFAGASATLAEPKQYCEHSTFGTEQHSPAAAAPLLLLHGLEASPLQSDGGTAGRHCWPTEQLQNVAALPRGGEGAGCEHCRQPAAALINATSEI